MEFLTNPGWNCVLNYFFQGKVILPNLILILGKLYEVGYNPAIWRERDGHNGILIVILRWVQAKDIGELLNKGIPILQEVHVLVWVRFVYEKFKVIQCDTPWVGYSKVNFLRVFPKLSLTYIEIDLILKDEDI